MAELTSLQINGNTVQDYIVAQGTSGIWTYRKWNSGIAECWYQKNVNVNFTTSTTWGNIYGVDNAVPSVTYPFTFTAIPTVVGTVNYCVGGSTWLYGSNAPSSTTASPAYGLARPTSIGADITVTVNFYVTGTWK